MTLSADELFPKQRTQRTMDLAPYVTKLAANTAHQAQISSDKRGPIPFSDWHLRRLTGTSHIQTGIAWWWRRRRLMRGLSAGGILVMIGPTRSGKSILASALCASGAVLMDETSYINRDAVLETIDRLWQERRGCIMVFSSAEAFREYEVAAYIAHFRVLFLHFPER